MVIGFLLMVAGLGLVIDAFSSWAPDYLVRLIASFSFVTHFRGMTSGLVDLTAVIYFVSLIALLLVINREIIDVKKAG